MDAVVSYQLLRSSISVSHVLFPLSLLLTHFLLVSLYLSCIMGEDKGLCGPFILSHSERWLQWIVGNRIQLCCRLCLCVCWCEHVQECVCVRARACVLSCSAGLGCLLTCFMSFWRQCFSFVMQPYLALTQIAEDTLQVLTAEYSLSRLIMNL